MNTKYPQVNVRLSGQDGNAFFIISRVIAALRRAGIDDAEIQAYQSEATAGDYDNVLQATMRWVNWS